MKNMKKLLVALAIFTTGATSVSTVAACDEKRPPTSTDLSKFDFKTNPIKIRGDKIGEQLDNVLKDVNQKLIDCLNQSLATTKITTTDFTTNAKEQITKTTATNTPVTLIVIASDTSTLLTGINNNVIIHFDLILSDISKIDFKINPIKVPGTTIGDWKYRVWDWINEAIIDVIHETVPDAKSETDFLTNVGLIITKDTPTNVPIKITVTATDTSTWLTGINNNVIIHFDTSNLF